MIVYGHGTRLIAIEMHGYGGLPLKFHMSLNVRSQRRRNFKRAGLSEDLVMSNIRDLRSARKYSSLKHCDSV